MKTLVAAFLIFATCICHAQITGVASRPSDVNLKNVYSVTAAYNGVAGAKGDGATDDTAAIQNCINAAAATGGTVYFPRPSSSYYVSHATSQQYCLTVPAGVTLMADPSSATLANPLITVNANSVGCAAIYGTGDNITLQNLSGQMGPSTTLSSTKSIGSSTIVVPTITMPVGGDLVVGDTIVVDQYPNCEQFVVQSIAGTGPYTLGLAISNSFQQASPGAAYTYLSANTTILHSSGAWVRARAELGLSTSINAGAGTDGDPQRDFASFINMKNGNHCSILNCSSESFNVGVKMRGVYPGNTNSYHNTIDHFTCENQDQGVLAKLQTRLQISNSDFQNFTLSQDGHSDAVIGTSRAPSHGIYITGSTAQLTYNLNCYACKFNGNQVGGDCSGAKFKFCNGSTINGLTVTNCPRGVDIENPAYSTFTNIAVSRILPTEVIDSQGAGLAIVDGHYSTVAQCNLEMLQSDDVSGVDIPAVFCRSSDTTVLDLGMTFSDINAWTNYSGSFTSNAAEAFKSSGSLYATFKNCRLYDNGSSTTWYGFGLTAAGSVSYTFTASGITTAPTYGSTYTNNGITYTVSDSTGLSGSPGSISGPIVMSGSGSPTSNGQLTHASGTGDATIAFSAVATNVSAVTFTVSGVTTTPGYLSKYSVGGNTYTVLSTSIAAGSGTILAAGKFLPTAASGNITNVSGTGDATIAWSAAATATIPANNNTIILPLMSSATAKALYIPVGINNATWSVDVNLLPASYTVSDAGTNTLRNDLGPTTLTINPTSTSATILSATEPASFGGYLQRFSNSGSITEFGVIDNTSGNAGAVSVEAWSSGAFAALYSAGYNSTAGYPAASATYGGYVFTSNGGTPGTTRPGMFAKATSLHSGTNLGTDITVKTILDGATTQNTPATFYNNGNFLGGGASLATNATTGFPLIGTSSGVPTGTPANIPSGTQVLTYDHTDRMMAVWDTSQTKWTAVNAFHPASPANSGTIQSPSVLGIISVNTISTTSGGYYQLPDPATCSGSELLFLFTNSGGSYNANLMSAGSVGSGTGSLTAATSTTSFTVTSTTGQIIGTKITFTSGNDNASVTYVTNIAGNVYTVSPALPMTPANGDTYSYITPPNVQGVGILNIANGSALKAFRYVSNGTNWYQSN